MMKGFSEVTLSGNLTKDPLVEEGYVKFTVAVETVYRTDQGFQKMTNFVPVVVFGGLTESAKKLVKGDYVIVVGELRSKITDEKNLLINVSANKIVKVSLTDNSGNGNNGSVSNNPQYDSEQYVSSRNRNQGYQGYSKQPPASNPNQRDGYSQPNDYGKYNQQTSQPQKQPVDDIPYNDDDDFGSLDNAETIPF